MLHICICTLSINIKIEEGLRGKEGERERDDEINSEKLTNC